LRFDKQSKPSKAPPVVIAKEASSVEAFRHIVGSGLRYMLANVAAADIGDVEGVHQIRVAIRHLRAVLRLFKPLLHSDVLGRFDGELRRYGAVFGKARDWDVFALQTLPTVQTDSPEASIVDTLRRAAQPARTDAHRDVAKAIRDPAFTRLVLGLASWVEDGVCSPEPLRAGMTNLARETAPALLDRMRQKGLTLGRHLRHASPERLHELRKAMKKLRYSVEFLSALYPRSQVKAYLAPCEELQELLGVINDGVVTSVLLDGLSATNEAVSTDVVRAVMECNGKRREHASQKLMNLWDQFHAADPFWQ
jgi:triphosphatase